MSHCKQNIVRPDKVREILVRNILEFGANSKRSIRVYNSIRYRHGLCLGRKVYLSYMDLVKIAYNIVDVGTTNANYRIFYNTFYFRILHCHQI